MSVEGSFTSEQQQLLEWAARLEVECLSLIELNKEKNKKVHLSDHKVAELINNVSDQLNLLQALITDMSGQLQSIKKQMDVSDKLTSSLYNKITVLEKRINSLEPKSKSSSKSTALDLDKFFPWEKLSAICDMAATESTRDIKEFLLILVPRVVEVERANRSIAAGQDEVCNVLRTLASTMKKTGSYNNPPSSFSRHNFTK